jgi:hypothetical protein
MKEITQTTSAIRIQELESSREESEPVIVVRCLLIIPEHTLVAVVVLIEL